MPEKYRPVTVAQWQEFDLEWCAECVKTPMCTILAEAALRKVSDSNYPKELVVRNATPVCTAFSSARAVVH